MVYVPIITALLTFFISKHTYNYDNSNKHVCLLERMELITFVFFSYQLSTCLSAVVKLNNIDYAGVGYDILVGNPHSDLYDPGFKQPVFDLTYNQVRVGELFVSYSK